jgi:hypothetical protein
MLLVWMNWIATNNAFCPNRTLNHRVTCLVALLAARISYWCGLASMYWMLLLLTCANFKYLFILLRCFVHKRYHFTRSFTRSFYIIEKSMISKILWRNNDWDGGSPAGMEVRYLLLIWNKLNTINNNNNNVTGGANWMETNWNRIESKLIRNRVELVPNRHPIESESNLNRIGSNRTSPPGNFLFQFDSSHIIRVWYNNTSQDVHIKSNQIEIE